MNRLLEEMAYGFRRLMKTPGFAVTVVLTLALSVGANLAVFQLLYAVLFAELPVARPGQLFSIHAVPSPFDGEWFYSYGAYQRLRQATGESAPVIARSGFGSGVLQEGGFSGQAQYQMVSANFFQVLGISPSAGRLFESTDDAEGQLEVPVVLRASFAAQRFGTGQNVVGRKAVLNQIPIMVVGVAPERFAGVVPGQAPDVWLPLSAQSTGKFGSWFDSLGPGDDHDLERPWRNQDGIFWLWVMARIPDGQAGAATGQVTGRWTQALQPDLRRIASAPVNSTKTEEEREHILHAGVQLVSAAGGEGSMGRRYGRPLTVLMAMAGMVFLVGCLNLANLQLARLASRRREIAVRIALGASRWRVLRQLLVEDLLLVAAGGLMALVTCKVGSTLLLRWASGRTRLISVDLHFGGGMFVVGAGLLALALLGFSLLPAWQVTRGELRAAMQGRIGVQGGRSSRWSSLLLAGQVSFSLLLLSMAALFTQTLMNLARVDVGLDREHLLVVNLDIDSGGLRKTNMMGLDARILEKLRALPFVRGAAIGMCDMPYCGWNTAIHVAGHPELAEERLHGQEDHVSVDYFSTMGIPLISGRVFTESDRPDTQRVVILNHAYAQKLFGDRDPVGRFVGYAAPPEDHKFQVIGMVGDARLNGLRQAAPPEVYFSLEQGEDAARNIYVRAKGSPAGMVADIRRALAAVDANLPIAEIVPLNVQFADGLSTEKLLARLTAIFGTITLALAAIGFYGLLSFHVQRRTSEIGVRMALGATREQVRGMFLRQTLWILVVGIVPGVVLTEFAGRTARALLFGVKATNPWAPLAAIAVLLGCGLLATAIPARRAASVDPIEALRAE
jgi:predicted permease